MLAGEHGPEEKLSIDIDLRVAARSSVRGEKSIDLEESTDQRLNEFFVDRFERIFRAMLPSVMLEET